MSMDNVREALAELVALKDLKDSLERAAPVTVHDWAMHGERWDDYQRRKPLAWAAARAALSTPNGWVAVSERLPPACATVLAFGPKPGHKRDGQRVQEYYTGTNPRCAVADEEVTHWMPLPNPPQEPPPIKETR